MKIIYKAWDGTEFDEKDACKKYEYDNPYVMMYNHKGKTSNPDGAFIVFLDYKTDDAEKFVELCKEQGTTSDGITVNDSGLYVWDEYREEYFYVSERVEEALKRYFED